MERKGFGNKLHEIAKEAVFTTRVVGHMLKGSVLNPGKSVTIHMNHESGEIKTTRGKQKSAN